MSGKYGSPISEDSATIKDALHCLVDVRILSCFQEGDDGQEDSIEVEKKEELGAEANPE